MTAQADSARSHSERIMRCVERDNAARDAHSRRAVQTLSPTVEASWRRCVVDYGLDPSGLRKVDILTQTEIRSHAEAVAEVLSLSRGVVPTLGQGFRDETHTILLADADGVILHRLGDLGLRDRPARTEIEPGALWDERRQGTNGIGTSLATGETASIYLSDHFAPGNTWLSCTSKPIRAPNGQLLGALNVTLLGVAHDRSRVLVEHVLDAAVRRIEDMLLLSRARRCWVLGLTGAIELAGVAPEGLLAVDEDGRIVGANEAARRMLPTLSADAPDGQPLDQILGRGLESVLRDRSASGAAALDLGGVTLFATARPPIRPSAGARPPAAAAPARPRRPAELTLADVAGGDARLAEEIDRVRRFVERKIPIVIAGETGTGKEVLAKALHQAGARAGKPFVAINCAAIPETLIESELFGYADGAFTGANRRGARGKIVQASGGTLFLDEIGDMPLEAQTRLLRVIAEDEVCPLGSDKVVAVDLQIICASHRDLAQLVHEGRFRADLLYRLDGASVTLPPLRERADKADLVRRVFEREAGELGIAARLDEAAAGLVLAHPWPGNIRQLRHALRAAIVSAPEGRVTRACLPASLARSAGAVAAEGHRRLGAAALPPPIPPDGADALLTALRRSEWRVSDAARALGVSRQALYRRMNRLGIVSPNRADSVDLRG